MARSAFGKTYVTKTGGLMPGRYDVEIVDAEFQEKVILFTPEAKEAGIVNKEFNDLNEEQKTVILEAERLSKNGDILPKVADRIVIHVKEPKSGTIMKWGNGLIIEMPYWQDKDKQTGEVANQNAFVDRESAPLGREFYELVGRVLGRELPGPGEQFAIGDLIKIGDKLSVEVEKDFKGFAKVKARSAEPFGASDPVALIAESVAEGSDADVLLKVLQSKKDTINGRPKGDVTMAIRMYISSGELPFDFTRAMDAWNKIRGQVLDADDKVAL